MTDLSGTTTARPPSVERAVKLLWIAVAIGVVSSVLTFMLIGGPTLGGLVAAVIGLAITAFLITKIGEGRHWARIVLLVLFVLGVAGFFLGSGLSFDIAPVLSVVGLVQLAIEAYALYLLFAPPGGDWFNDT